MFSLFPKVYLTKEQNSKTLVSGKINQFDYFEITSQFQDLLTYLLMNNAQSSGNNTEHAFLFFSGGLILYKNKCVYILLLYFSFNVIKLYYLSPYRISIGLRQTHIDN